MLSTSSLLALAAAIAPTRAQTFCTLDLRTPENITSFSGSMVVPKNWPTNYPSSGATYYLWPGLQGGSAPGVLQNVLGLNQQVGSWYVGSVYCCQSGIPWGDGEPLSTGEEFTFSNYVNPDYTWTSETGYQGQSGYNNTSTFDVTYSYNVAVWAVELYSPATWNFGEVVWYAAGHLLEPDFLVRRSRHPHGGGKSRDEE